MTDVEARFISDEPLYVELPFSFISRAQSWGLGKRYYATFKKVA